VSYLKFTDRLGSTGEAARSEYRAATAREAFRFVTRLRMDGHRGESLIFDRDGRPVEWFDLSRRSD